MGKGMGQTFLTPLVCRGSWQVSPSVVFLVAQTPGMSAFSPAFSRCPGDNMQNDLSCS